MAAYMNFHRCHRVPKKQHGRASRIITGEAYENFMQVECKFQFSVFIQFGARFCRVLRSGGGRPSKTNGYKARRMWLRVDHPNF